MLSKIEQLAKKISVKSRDKLYNILHSVHQRHLVCTAGTRERLFNVSYGANHSDESTR